MVIVFSTLSHPKDKPRSKIRVAWLVSRFNSYPWGVEVKIYKFETLPFF